ncbi:MAG: restriction endonuclease subunit S [Deltaproteobacteria bacterium]|nr:restriction endonuclease subunit S [Myxococcales bacterium]MDP3220218.1 restriction endonuclease subunit S [Deltaproteobacteria bacterium]
MSARAMKDSGVAWLGEIPAGWEMVRLGRMTTAYCDGPFGSALKSSHYVSEGVRVIRLQNVGAGEFRGGDAAFISEEHFTTLGRHEVRQGDLIIAGLGDDRHPVGRACVAPAGIGRAMVKADCFRFRLHENRAVPAFVSWYLASDAARSDAGAQGRGATRVRINLQDAVRLQIPVPPFEEQKRIAAFLDAHTTTIDTAIAEHERNLDLLAERRRTLVSSAVTRGLDPKAPMRDSGVSWIGPIPATWNIVDLRRLVDPSRPITYGIVLPGENVADGVPIVKSGDCTPERLTPERLHRTTRAIEAGYGRSRLRGGDLVISIRGTVGLVALVPPSLEGANLTQDAARIAPTAGTDTGWLQHVLRSTPIQIEIAHRTVGATVRGLNLRELRNVSTNVRQFR